MTDSIIDYKPDMTAELADLRAWMEGEGFRDNIDDASVGELRIARVWSVDRVLTDEVVLAAEDPRRFIDIFARAQVELLHERIAADLLKYRKPGDVLFVRRWPFSFAKYSAGMDWLEVGAAARGSIHRAAIARAAA